MIRLFRSGTGSPVLLQSPDVCALPCNDAASSVAEAMGKVFCLPGLALPGCGSASFAAPPSRLHDRSSIFCCLFAVFPVRCSTKNRTEAQSCAPSGLRSELVFPCHKIALGSVMRPVTRCLPLHGARSGWRGCHPHPCPRDSRGNSRPLQGSTKWQGSG